MILRGVEGLIRWLDRDSDKYLKGSEYSIIVFLYLEIRVSGFIFATAERTVIKLDNLKSYRESLKNPYPRWF